jgi:uncharacterized protein
MLNFVGRTQELTLLQTEYARSRPSLVVVYGRRRVGKSTLIIKSLQGRSVYYQANRLTNNDNLALLKQALVNQLELSFRQKTILQPLDWVAFWAFVQQLSHELGGLSLVLDEFPYLCEAHPALPSILQAAWDKIRLENSPINLVLCGSAVAFMGELLAEKNPLRGRHTAQIHLKPLSYRDMAQMLPYGLEEKLVAYGIWGGLPYYLALLEQKPLLENLLHTVLLPGSPLYDEPTSLLQAELKSPARYASILRAIAEGCHDYSSIIGRVKDFKDRSQLSAYMHKLEELQLIEVVRPFDASPKERNNRYALADPFLVFWYRFVLPNRSTLEAGHHKAVLDSILPQLNTYMGLVFERVCREYLRLYAQETLGAPLRRVGQIWSREYDIDAVGEFFDGQLVVAECKWWDKPVGANVLKALEEHAKKAGLEAALVLFSRSGYTPELGEKRVKRLGLAELLGPT